MNDTTEFRVTYDGPALESHEMDPREPVDLLRDVAELGRESAVSDTTREKEVLSVGSPVAEDVLIIDGVRESASSLTSLTFKKNNRWRLSDGNLMISATITDNAFLSTVRNKTKHLSKQRRTCLQTSCPAVAYGKWRA